tara:strand:+ start:580 stop:753 length:174 start_codon:yes stop_codon:yes gene_type:complete
MNITNAKYIEEPAGTKLHIDATIDGELMSVPMDTMNRHYIEILQQIADGKLSIAEAD